MAVKNMTAKDCAKGAKPTALGRRTRALSALCLLDYHCFSWSYVSSADLHVVECTFKCGFDSFRAHHLTSSSQNIYPMLVLAGGKPRNFAVTSLRDQF